MRPSAPTPPLRVALANDYEVVVRGLEQMLQPHAERVQVVELDAQVPVAHEVDVTLYDTFAQREPDFGEIDEVIANPRAGRVVVYSWDLHPELVSTALEKGARGYLDKTLSAAELVEALHAIHQGQVVVSPQGQGSEDATPETTVDDDWPGKAFGLTSREAEMVALITSGLSNHQIARACYLSINSVKSYIRTAYRKMGVTSRSQAVLWGVGHGMSPDRSRAVRPPAAPAGHPG